MSGKRVCLVTGGSRGIGAGICKTLAEPDSVVCFTHYDQDEQAANASKIAIEDKGAQCEVFYFDISNYEETAEVINKIKDKFGSLDVLINNAGITIDSLLVRMSESAWDKVIDVNLKSVFNATQAAAKIMMRQRSGRIVSIASISGVMGNIGQTNYSASKAGIIGMTKTIAQELGPRGITVNAIAPGFIRTEMTEILPEKIKEQMLGMTPLKRFGEIQEVADLVDFLISDKAAYITGQVIHLNGGMYM